MNKSKATARSHVASEVAAIRAALKKRGFRGDNPKSKIQNRMTYFKRLHPWCIIPPLPNLQTPIVARFRRRSDAEAHLQILQRLIPTATYSIIFDVTPEETDPGLNKSAKSLTIQSLSSNTCAISRHSTETISSACKNPEAMQPILPQRKGGDLPPLHNFISNVNKS